MIEFLTQILVWDVWRVDGGPGMLGQAQDGDRFDPPGSPSGHGRWSTYQNNGWGSNKRLPLFCAHFPPLTTMDLVNSRCWVIFVQKSETPKMWDCKYPELVNNSLLMRTWEKGTNSICCKSYPSLGIKWSSAMSHRAIDNDIVDGIKRWMSSYLGKDFDLRMMKVARRRFPSLSWVSLPSQKESSFFDTSASFSLSCTLIAT